MIFNWRVTAFQDSNGLWGARWETHQRGQVPGPAEGQLLDTTEPRVYGQVEPVFTQASDARGHAAMWIARYEDACAYQLEVAADPEPWVPTPEELATALDADRARFGPGNVQLGGG